MEVRRWLTICCVWLHFAFFLHRHSLPANCVELHGVRRGLSDCLFEDRDACNEARHKLCKWSESARKCYPKANEKKSFVGGRQLQQVQDCLSVIYKDECKSLEHCRWCKSQVLDDGCFKALEARRLPIQVFDCSTTR